jgi:hypothetical protein
VDSRGPPRQRIRGSATPRDRIVARANVSSFSWLDYDERETQRFRELVATLDEPETVDSLGLSSIRDTLADMLFPGTSTIQTRARYFLLVPWAAQLVERKRPADARQFDRWFSAAEVSTLERLRSGTRAHEGVIGYEGNDVQRLPSSVYWRGLGIWGIRIRRDISYSEYRAHVVRSGRLDDVDPEGDEGGTTSAPIWDELPAPPEGFPDAELSIRPTKDEGLYLLERMQSTRIATRVRSTDSRSERSLLAIMAQGGWTPVASLWDIPVGTVSGYLESVLDNARAFAEVMQGARLLYNRMLCDAGIAAGLGDFQSTVTILEPLEVEWIRRMVENRDRLTEWSGQLDDFFILIEDAGGRVTAGTRQFVRSWVAEAVQDSHAALHSKRSRDRVRARELDVKDGGARLHSRGALSRWRGALFGSGYMSYRWSIASRHLVDCRSAQGGSDAGA